VARNRSPLWHDRRIVPFDFDAVVAPFRMQPGLRRLGADARHLTPSRSSDRTLREKLGVLRAWPAQAAVSMPGFDAAPALRALAERAALEHGDSFAIETPLTWRALQLGWAVHDADVVGSGPPEIGHVLQGLPREWRHAALLSLAFHEDFAVIERDGGRIPWILACLPSGWAPEEKVGKRFVDVHAPVADSGVLLAAADGLARIVTSGEAWERFVWTLADEPRLHRHPRHVAPSAWDPELDAEHLFAAAWLRTERQTFLPVRGHAQAVFTIQVEVRSLREALVRHDDALRMRAALASMSDAVLAYRGLAPARDRLLAGLDAHAATLLS